MLALTEQQLTKSVTDLILFNEFTFFGERDVDCSTGFTFALEFLAVSLGLVDDDNCSAELMEELVVQIDKHALSIRKEEWRFIRPHLPYMRSINAENAGG